MSQSKDVDDFGWRMNASREARRQAAHEATEMYEVLSKEWHLYLEEASMKKYHEMVTPPQKRCKTCGK